MRRPTACLVLLGLLAAGRGSAVQPGFRIHADEFGLEPLERLTAGLRFQEIPLSQLTTSGAANAAALEALSSWDFTPAGSILGGATNTVSQAVPATSAWTCYLPDTLACGFGASDVDVLVALDAQLDGRATRDVSALAYDAGTGVLKARASVSDEGRAGATGEAETRLCLGTGSGAPIVPIAAFPNVSGQRRFMAAGDAGWQSPVFDCAPLATLSAPCKAAGGVLATLTAEDGQTEGRIRTRVVRAGTVKLPSGHVLDSLLVETFSTYTVHGAACPSLFPLKRSRQWSLGWMVPHHGIVASLTSADDVPALASFTTASRTFLGFGLLPPVSIAASQLTPTSVTVSWNPGLLGPRLTDGYEVHWGPVSGKQQAPSFHSGPIPAGTTSYVIDGLTAGQTIHVSVTTRRSYQDPVSGVTTQYESIRLPQFLGSDANGDGTLETSYPPEVSVTTPTPAPCVAGDIYPDGLGSGTVTLADYALARRKVAGSVAVNARDRSCGDVHPGAFSCQPQGQPGRWCAAPNALFQTGDMVLIRRKVGNLVTFACGGCPQVAAGPSPHDLRLPGDLAPRAASDGVVDVADVVLALRASVGLLAPSPEELLRGDVAPASRSGDAMEPAGDGAVDVADVVLLLRAAVGIETLRWPLRGVDVRLDDEVDLVAHRVEVSGWPAWARPEAHALSLLPASEPTTQEAVGSAWVAIGVSDPDVVAGPVDLFTWQYRGPEAVDPATLRVDTEGTRVVLPDLSDEPPASITLR